MATCPVIRIYFYATSCLTHNQQVHQDELVVKHTRFPANCYYNYRARGELRIHCA